MAWQTLLDPPVLFFIVGLASVWVRADLQVPPAVTKFLSLYLLMAIGFKGGVYLSKAGLSDEFLLALVGGIGLSALSPLMVFFFLRSRLGVANAAAIGATYGSVSAVTFVAATTWLENRGLEFSGAMIAVMALMEAPAIVLALMLARGESPEGQRRSVGQLLHEALFNGSVFLLLGSLVAGVVSGPMGSQSIGAFVFDLFKGLLGFFLLDLGSKSGKALARSKVPLWLVPIGIVVPLINAALAILWGWSIDLSPSATFLLMALGAGASYIAVPAALRLALPQAESGLYLTLALGVTFPFNLLVGLPLYWYAVKHAFGV